MNKWKPLDPQERAEIRKINDPLINLILINGWRRNEISQALLNHKNDQEFVIIKPKKSKELKKILITREEIKLIKIIKENILENTKKSLSAYNKKINRYFQNLASFYNLNDLFPHRIRATFATNFARMGVDRFTIKEAMNHKNLKTTEGYINPDQEDILEAKKLNTELKTLDGMTIFEWRKFALEKIKQIRRLEEKINERN